MSARRSAWEDVAAMGTRLPPDGRDVTDSFAPPGRCFCPPAPGEGEALTRWLELSTPLGAPVLRVGVRVVPLVHAGPQLIPGVRYVHRRGAHATDRWENGRPARARDRALARSPWVAQVLREAAPKVPEEHLGLLVDLLAPEPTRPDGLPAFWRGVLQEAPPSDLAFKAHGAGYTLRAMAAAVATDLRAMTPAQIGEALPVNDHVAPGLKGGADFDGDARGVRRYVAAGRPILAALGAWPWSCFTECAAARRPPGDWWTLPAALEPLTRWHFSAWRALWLEARRSRGEGAFGPITPGEHEEALAEWEAAAVAAG
jgi:hypothetical protein